MFVVERPEDEGDDHYYEQHQRKVIFQTLSKNVPGMKIKQELEHQGETQAPHASVADQDFEVELVATDGENTFGTVVKSKLLNYLMKDQQGNLEEWTRIARSILFGTPLSATKPIVCTYNSMNEKSLTLNVRQGHAPRPGAEASIPLVGSFVLANRTNKKTAVTPFQMLVMSASKLGPSLAEARMLRNQFNTVQTQVSQFIQEKSEMETELFEKFTMVLNQKKAKLRALKSGIDISEDEDEIENLDFEMPIDEPSTKRKLSDAEDQDADASNNEYPDDELDEGNTPEREIDNDYDDDDDDAAASTSFKFQQGRSSPASPAASVQDQPAAAGSAAPPSAEPDEGDETE